MNIAIRIRHYADGYERLVGPSDYACWRRTEQRIGKPIFQVIGILIGKQYINLEDKVV
mgnify:CR=1 FL=1